MNIWIRDDIVKFLRIEARKCGVSVSVFLETMIELVDVDEVIEVAVSKKIDLKGLMEKYG